MTTIVDDKRRAVLPKTAKPGDILDIEKQGVGRWILTRLVKPKTPKVKIIQRYGRPVISVGRPVNLDEINRVLADFP